MTSPAGHLADLELALRAAVDAGELVRRDFGAPGAVTHKTPDQPLTEADLAVDRMLRDRLGDARPGYGWLSEETRDDRARLERSRVWIVDPIDGTRSFIESLPECVISVGLAEDGVAVVGVLHNALTGELYWAVRDAGAYGALLVAGDCQAGEAEAERLVACDDVDQIVGGEWGRFTLMHDIHEEREGVRLLVSRSEMDAGDLDDLPAAWARIRRGSTAYKMAGVAAGAGNAYVSRGSKSEWDVCAAALLVEESGGVVSDLSGSSLEFNRPSTRIDGMVAARDAELHARLLERAGGTPAGGTTPEDDE